MTNEILSRLKIKSITELYCDVITKDDQLTFLNELYFNRTPKDRFYIGCSLDEKITTGNRKFYRLDKTKSFVTLDATESSLPKCDLIIVNKFFWSLSIRDLWLLLANLKESYALYMMLERNPQQNGTRLNDAPFYLPQPEMTISIRESDKFFDIYLLDKIAFLLDYAEEKDALLRAQAYPHMQTDFAKLYQILGHQLFYEFLLSFKHGVEFSVDFVSRPKIQELFSQQNNLGRLIRNHYYRILFRREFEEITEIWSFYKQEDFFKYYLILLNYLNFLLFEARDRYHTSSISDGFIKPCY